MPVRTAEAQWEGSLQEGTGTMRLGSGAFEGRYSFVSRGRLEVERARVPRHRPKSPCAPTPAQTGTRSRTCPDPRGAS